MNIALSPKGFVGRLTIVFLGAVLFQFAGSILLHDQVDRYTLREDHARRVAELLVVGERLLTDAEAADRATIVQALSSAHLQVELKDRPHLDGGEAGLSDIRQRIVAWEPSLADNDIRLTTERRKQIGPAPGRGFDLVGAMQLSNGAWLHFRSRDIFGRWPLLYRTFGTALILGVTTVACAAALIMVMAEPLRALARAAHHVGEGTAVTISERGPRDLNEVARAFNTMQARIARLIADRSIALAAVSHDLRTPLARLRLRADLISDPVERQTISADIIEMQSMLDSVLALMSGDGDPEKPRLVDLASLVGTLVSADADAGQDVTYTGPDHLALNVRPVSLKRALANLIENGLKYGGRVRVSLGRTGDEVRIAVDDDGPGIPEEDLEAVTEPFVRLDAARQRDTPGLGLGLSIAARAAEIEGGALRLSNRPEGGLRAEIVLPAPLA